MTTNFVEEQKLNIPKMTHFPPQPTLELEQPTPPPTPELTVHVLDLEAAPILFDVTVVINNPLCKLDLVLMDESEPARETVVGCGMLSGTRVCVGPLTAGSRVELVCRSGMHSSQGVWVQVAVVNEPIIDLREMDAYEIGGFLSNVPGLRRMGVVPGALRLSGEAQAAHWSGFVGEGICVLSCVPQPSVGLEDGVVATIVPL